MKFLSLCSGIDAASMAWNPLGWEACAFSEIEPFPAAVLKHHYPDVPNLGDMTKFTTWPDANTLRPDLIVGGTPCQSFSVAGLRKGLTDPRGNLALTFLAIAQRYRARWLVWENVPGVFSATSHDAPDPCPPPPPVEMERDGQEMESGDQYFAEELHALHCFLAGLSELGYGWAYRVLDAQHFGVPQRRRRIFVVAYLGDWTRAAAVLFERHSLQGHPAPCREEGENPAPSLSARTNGGGGLGTDFDLDGGLISSTGEISHCLNAGGMGRQDYESETMICTLPAVCPSCCQRLIDKNLAVCGDTCPACSDPLLGVSHSLRAQPQSAHDASLETYVTHALTAEGHDASEDGTGRGTPIIPVPFGVDESPDVAHCLRSGASKADKHESTTYIAQHIGFDSLQAGDTMMGITYDGSPPLRGHQGRVAVAFAENSRSELRLENGDGQQNGALSTGGGKPGQGTPTIAYTLHGTDGTASIASEDETAQCLRARAPGIENSSSTIVLSYAVRRLTARECERLQGFPDDYTLIPWRGKRADQCPDGPRYKALGNSMAIPPMHWIGERIALIDSIP